MKANELRIGNYHVWDGQECQAEAEHISAIFYGNLSVRPIPLTVEWLLRLGLDQIQEPEEWNDFEALFDTSDIMNNTVIRVVDSRVSFINPDGYETVIEYVHRMQNIYFAFKCVEIGEN